MIKCKKLEIVTLPYNEYFGLLTINGSFPSNFYFRNAFGDYLFIKTRDRDIASLWLKAHYGSKYALRVIADEKGTGCYTAKGVATRKGQKKYN